MFNTLNLFYDEKLNKNKGARDIFEFLVSAYQDKVYNNWTKDTSEYEVYVEELGRKATVKRIVEKI